METPRRPSRRVVLNPEIQDTPQSIQDRQSDESVSDGESSTMSIMGASEVSGEDEFRDVDDEPAMAERAFPGLAMRVGFFGSG